MDDLNPLAGTAHLLEEVDSKLIGQMTRKNTEEKTFFLYREIDGIATRWQNVNWLFTFR